MIYLLLGIIVIALDQFTKYLVRGMESDEVIHVIGDFLRIVHVENSGAAFGLFEGSRRFLLIFPAVIIAGAVYLIFRDLGSDLKGRLSKVSLALVASGGIGNMIDRFARGSVIDFLDFHWQEVYHYPSFNVADMAISVGVCLYVAYAFFGKKKGAAEDAPK